MIASQPGGKAAARSRSRRRRFKKPSNADPPRENPGDLSPPPHRAIHVAPCVLLLEGIALVVELASAGDADLDLGHPVLEIDLERDERESLLGGLVDELVDLAAM